MMNAFTGAAYFEVATRRDDWSERATAVLVVLNDLKLAQVSIANPGGAWEATIGVDGAQPLRILVTVGTGQGTVPASDGAGALVCILAALRAKVGDLRLVADTASGTDDVPRRVNQSFELYRKDWARVNAIAEALGLKGAGNLGALTHNVF